MRVVVGYQNTLLTMTTAFIAAESTHGQYDLNCRMRVASTDKY